MAIKKSVAPVAVPDSKPYVLQSKQLTVKELVSACVAEVKRYLPSSKEVKLRSDAEFNVIEVRDAKNYFLSVVTLEIALNLRSVLEVELGKEGYSILPSLM